MGVIGLGRRAFLRSYLSAGDGPHQAIDDDPFVALETLGDDAVAINFGAKCDPPALHHFLVVDDEDIGTPLVITQGYFRHQESHFGLGNGDAHPGKHSGQDNILGVVENGPEHQAAGGGIEGDGGKIEVTLMGIAFLIGEADVDGVNFVRYLFH